MKFTVVVTATLILVLSVLIAFLITNAKKHKSTLEHFSLSLTRDAIDNLVREAGVQSCDLLRQDELARGMDAASVSQMYMALDTMRINKWKPRSVNERTIIEKNPNKEYCYMYDDRRGDVQDYRMSADTCSMDHHLFKGNPMITRVFSSSNIDNVHPFPVHKCVVEIDRVKAKERGGSNLTGFWNVWGPTHCDALSAHLINTLRDRVAQEELKETQLNALLGSNEQLSCTYASMSNFFHKDCTPCNDVWKNKYDMLQNEYGELSGILEDRTIWNQYYASSNAVLYKNIKGLESNITLEQGLYDEQHALYTNCIKQLRICRDEEADLEKEYDELYRIYAPLEKHVNNRRKVYKDRSQVLKRWVEVRNPECANELQAAERKRNEQKVKTDIMVNDYNTCVPERITEKALSKAAYDLFVTNSNLRYRCEERERELEKMYDSVVGDVEECKWTVSRLEERKDIVVKDVELQNNALKEAKGRLRTLEDDLRACSLAREKNVRIIAALLEDNVNLFNKYELAAIKMSDVDMDAISDQLKQVQAIAAKVTREQIGENAALSKNVCTLKNEYAAELRDVERQIAEARLRLEELKVVGQDCSKCVATEDWCQRMVAAGKFLTDSAGNKIMCQDRHPRPSNWQHKVLKHLNRW